MVDEVLGGEADGDVEGEVAAFAVGGKVGEVIVVADQIPVGFGGANLFQDPFLAGLKDARWDDPDRAAGGGGGVALGVVGAEGLDGVAVVFRVFELAVDRVSTVAVECGFELGEAADDKDEFGFAERCVGACLQAIWRCYRLQAGSYIGGRERPAFGLGALAFEFDDGVAAEAVEFAYWEHDVAFEVRDEGAEFEGSAAEAAELFAEAGWR